MANYLLAIVIPAFKSDYFYETLESLARQTNQNFKVYIGDDASPQNLEVIIDRFRSRLNIYYKRFPANLGKTSLVAHWNRCVALTTEPYVCLFSDDDLMDPDCIMNFYRSLADTKREFDLYRFNSAVIDSQGSLTAYNSPHPQIESNSDFLLNRLQFRRMSFVSEYIFKREAYQRESGFVDFPLAWFSDDASWIVFSRLTGIYTIGRPLVYWRSSNKNISIANNSTSYKKLKADILYAKWICNSINQKIVEIPDMKKNLFRISLQRWFFEQLDNIGIDNLNLFHNIKIARLVSPYLKMSPLRVFVRLLDFNRMFKLLKRRIVNLM